MSTPSYEPRTYAKQPKLFGSESIMQWKPTPNDASDTTVDQVSASKRQHIIALAIHRALAKKGTSMRSYAASHPEITYTRFAAVMRGEAIMKLDDIANAERNLELSFWNNPDLWSGFRP